MRAKTGTLAGVISLSGYAQLASGSEAVFAVLVNDAPVGDAAARGAVDRFAEALVGAVAIEAVADAAPSPGKARGRK